MRIEALAQARGRLDRRSARQETAGHYHLLRLKRSYRQIIIDRRPEARLVYLRGSRELIARHLAGRDDHFMPASLLQSQIDTLEEPGPDEDPLIIDLGPPPSEIAEAIIRLLGASATVNQSAAGA
jgi:carbohydrate kinase (thermoresistant glucokinase family)